MSVSRFFFLFSNLIFFSRDDDCDYHRHGFFSLLFFQSTFEPDFYRLVKKEIEKEKRRKKNEKKIRSDMLLTKGSLTEYTIYTDKYV